MKTKPKFKIGDTVKIVQTFQLQDKKYLNDVVTIKGIHIAGDPYYVEENDRPWSDFELKLVKTSSKFKKGDKVTVKQGCSGCVKGKEYILQNGFMGGCFRHKLVAGGINVGDTEGGDGCACQSNWVPVKESKAKFKVGDTVKIIGEGITLSASKNKGYVGKITRVNDGDWINPQGPRAKKCGNYYYDLDHGGVHEWQNGLELVPQACGWCGRKTVKLGVDHGANAGDQFVTVMAIKDIRANQAVVSGKDFVVVPKNTFKKVLHPGFIFSFEAPQICEVKGCTNVKVSKGKGGYKSKCGGCINRKRRLLKELEKYAKR